MRIAITGGIGSGKSYVCHKLKERGIDVYDCDSAAKRLMNESRELKDALSSLVGNEIYIDGKLNKALMASFILASEANKQAVNAVVHPAVIADFYASEMQWMECAILFEAHLNDKVDFIVAVTASEETRVKRIMQRDNISREKALAWIHAQFPQEEVIKQSDFVINNNPEDCLEEQLNNLAELLESREKQIL